MCQRQLGSWVAVVSMALPVAAHAGAKLQLTEDSYIDVGFQLQGFYFNTQRNIDEDAELETANDFSLRRGRVRMKSEITKYVDTFFQTEVASTGNALDVRMLDAWMRLKPHPWVSLYIGQLLAPANRQGLSSPRGAMTIDRPSLSSRSLTWGARARPGFTLNRYADGDSGLRGKAGSRDLGAILFGSVPLAEIVHVNYWLSVFDGVQNAGEDHLRYTARLQVNIFDREPRYNMISTYLGDKRTVAIGASVDLQNAVDIEDATGRQVDYRHYSVDVFVEHPLGPGFVTAEGALSLLDLGDAGELRTAGGVANQAAGKGFFTQLGYRIAAFQPWAGVEAWESDADDGRGSFWATKIGMNYLIKEHHARIVAGYELFRSDRKISASTDNAIGTFTAAMFVYY